MSAPRILRASPRPNVFSASLPLKPKDLSLYSRGITQTAVYTSQDTPSSLWQELFPSLRQGKNALNVGPTESNLSSSRHGSVSKRKEILNESGLPLTESQKRAREIERHIKLSDLERDNWQQRDRSRLKRIQIQNPTSNFLLLEVGDATNVLTKSDFLRVAPTGLHLPEWRAGGQLLNVFPARDVRTLEYRGFHILEFATPEAASRYLSYAGAQHNIVQSSESLRLRQKWELNAISVADIQKNFTLASASQPLPMTMEPDTDGSFRILMNHSKSDLANVLFTISHAGLSDQWLKEKFGPNASIIEQDQASLLSEDSEFKGPAILHLDDLKSKNTAAALPMTRWRLIFPGRTEARRFVRDWHQAFTELTDGLQNSAKEDVSAQDEVDQVICTAEVLF